MNCRIQNLKDHNVVLCSSATTTTARQAYVKESLTVDAIKQPTISNQKMNVWKSAVTTKKNQILSILRKELWRECSINISCFIGRGHWLYSNRKFCEAGEKTEKNVWKKRKSWENKKENSERKDNKKYAFADGEIKLCTSWKVLSHGMKQEQKMMKYEILHRYYAMNKYLFLKWKM